MSIVMQKNLRSNSLRSTIVFITVVLNAIVLKLGLTNGAQWYWALFLTIPSLMMAISTYKQDTKGF